VPRCEQQRCGETAGKVTSAIEKVTGSQNDAGLQNAAMVCVTVRSAGLKSHRLSVKALW